MAKRNDILKAAKPRTEEVKVPEWGDVTVTVRELTADDRDRYEMAMVDGRRGATALSIRALICALTIVHETGERVFSDADAGELGKLSARGLDRVASVAFRLSGIGGSALEAVAGNSAAPDGGASSSGSPSS